MSAIAYPLPIAYIQRRPAFALFLPLDVRDNEGRALMENRSLNFRSELAPVVPCLYDDFRTLHAKPINVAALKAFNRQGGRTFALFSSYCHSIATLHGSPGKAETLHLWQVAKLGVTAVTRSAVDMVMDPTSQAEVEAAAGGIYKISRGLASLFEEIIKRVPSDKSWTADEIFSVIVDNQVLIGPREVCAAPLPLIRRVLTHIVSELSAKNSALSPPLAAVELEYASFYSLMERLCFAYQMVRCSHLIHRLGRPAADLIAGTRHTFAAAREAVNVANESLELRIKALRSLRLLHWTALHPVHESLMTGVCELGVLTLTMRSQELEQMWQRFSSLCIDTVQTANTGLASLRKAGEALPPITLKDMEVFFGMDPQATNVT